ncbi:alkaline-phosphatase-like protein [Microdochium trichocladiopsis]|uniref:Alkaline-phosphatase-like protein n=1 Tax=Microdochium trichocladiopsis TaxID=1682393 RepID=A0A9P8YJG5_9PEZI|nr:alkaline-phosphatase-like protein [Microdochium trichocladiopsis]KAH7041539.1 alkaline-phosphatase-like protein [Microdochium trichocladiopsis]
MATTHRLPPRPQPLQVSSANGGSRPNYIIFMPDQLRYDSLACTDAPTGDGKLLRTPHIDGFRARGTLFTNCYTQASVCSQSRCSIFTATYPHVSGHRSLNNLIKPWEPNLFRSLREEGGYHVACLAPRGDTFAPHVTELSLDEYGFLETPEFMPRFGKGQQKLEAPPEDIFSRLFYKGLRKRNATENNNNEDGEDDDPASDLQNIIDYDEAVIRSAEQWLDCPPTDKPWVLFMPLIFPHCPFAVEEPYFSMYDRTQLSSPLATSNPAAKTGYEPRYMAANRARYGTDRATDDVWREVKATYYGMITRLDDQFGRILRKVDSVPGLWDETVTMFFTDHGEYLGDHGMIEKWPSGLSDALVREPLIIGGAGLPRGKTVAAMTEMVDLCPTMFEMSGIGEHFPHNGKSWIPVLCGDATEHKPYAFSEGGFLTSEEPLLEQAPYPYDIKAALQHEDTELVGKAVSLRDREWAYVYRLYEPAELYHRHSDPHELHNLAAEAEHKERVDKYEKVMMRWLMEGSDFVPWEKDDRFPKVELKSPKEQLEERQRNGGKTAAVA